MPASIRITTRAAALTLLGAALLAPAPTRAAEPAKIGTFKAWEAYTYDAGGAKVCYMVSVPTKSAGNYTRRDPTYLMVTHRPNERSHNVVSVTAGYTYRKDSDVTVDVDGKPFRLFTAGDTAWSENEDDTITDAIRRGNRLVVKGTSARGTETTDTYSLSGSGAAYDAITSACGLAS